MIRRHGWDWKKYTDRQYCQVCHNLIWKTDNLPFDGHATIAGVNVPIEIKKGDTSFGLADIRANQHEGLTAWMHKHKRPTWLALSMGTDRVNSHKPLRYRTWLLPWSVWLDIEDELQVVGFKSLPYSRDATNRKALLESNLTAVQRLASYELVWSTWPDGAGWAIPPGHIFARTYELLSWPKDVNTQSQLEFA